MTFSRDDPKPIQDYMDSLVERFNGKDIDEIIKEIVSDFKEEEHPKILIVTDMLLTGFDAPILQTMYLDKPLKEHKLLQAIARTNRPYKDAKEVGLIIDYIGIVKEFKKAFEMYSKEEMDGAIYDLQQLRKEFADLLGKIMKMFEEVPKDKYDRETLLKAIEVITSVEEKTKTFVKSVGTLRRLFELLGPDQLKLQLFSDYKWVIAIYTYYTMFVLRNSKDAEYKYIEQYLQKTIKYVQKTTEVESFKKDLPILEFDEHF